LLFLLVSGNFPGWELLATLPLLIVHVCFAIGLGMVVGVLNVFFRDAGQFFTVLLQFWFWLTPIVYPSSILPEFIKNMLVLNPMAGLISGYQTIFVHGEMPNWLELLPITAAAALFCVLGLRLFRRRAGEMVDEL